MTKRELQDALERSEFDRRLAELKYEPIAMPARQNLPPLPAVPVLMRGKQVPKEPPAMQELVDLENLHNVPAVEEPFDFANEIKEVAAPKNNGVFSTFMNQLMKKTAAPEEIPPPLPPRPSTAPKTPFSPFLAQLKKKIKPPHPAPGENLMPRLPRKITPVAKRTRAAGRKVQMKPTMLPGMTPPKAAQQKMLERLEEL